MLIKIHKTLSKKKYCQFLIKVDLVSYYKITYLCNKIKTIMSTENENNILFEKEEKVRSLIKNDNGTELFIQTTENKFIALTYNPTHKETFKLYEEDNTITMEVFLDNLYDYLTRILKSPNILNYTVVWHKKYGDTFTSYFSVSDMSDLCEKFYVNKNKHDYIINKIEISATS